MARTPAARLPLACSLLGRLPEGMLGLAIVLLVGSATASFAQAGLTVATFGAGGAVGGIVQARWIDRSRQTPALVGCGLVQPAALAVLVAAATHRVLPLALALAAVAGLAAPQLSPCMRALWAELLPDGPSRQAALALDAVVVEAVFLVGPALVAGMLALLEPAAAVLVAAGTSGAGTLGFAASGASRTWRGGRQRAAGGGATLAGPLSSLEIRTVLLAAWLFGVGDGAVQIAVPAYAVRHGTPALAGLLLTGMSLGSVAGGLFYGSRSWPERRRFRFAALNCLLGGGLALAALAAGPYLPAAGPCLLAAALVLAGSLVAPIATESSLLVDAAAPQATVTEAFAWLITAVVVGTAAGSAAAGPLVERFGGGATMLAAAAAPASAGLVTLLRHDSARR